MSKRVVGWSRWVRVVAAGVLLAVAGCATYPKARVAVDAFPAAERARAESNLQVFNAVWDLVNRKHFERTVDGVDWEQMASIYGPRAAAAPDERALYEVLNEMLGHLHDSHTHALLPDQVEERRTHERARTGFALTRVDDRWVVSDVLPGSPAEKAGVMPGWVVLARNGQPIGDRPAFFPHPGDKVSWDFLDVNDRHVALTMTARVLTTAAWQVSRELAGGILYLRFDEFDSVDRRWLGRELRSHRHAPGVIIDLRRNPGGDTGSLGISIGEFFDHAVDWGTFVSRRGRRTDNRSWQWGSAHYHGPVVVLIDSASASSAEIFAAVLHDQHRATLIGRKTAGAVLASWFYWLPDGGQLQLSGADYFTPAGRRIEGHGVEPDIVVHRTLADIRAGRDPDLEMALQVLARRRTPTAPTAAAAGK